MAASYLAGSVSIKTLIIPEWWLLAPMPVAFVLVAIEFVFRMQRLGRAEHAPRTDVVTVA
jgi:TRAP-type C4-dicarboxylate transport system permease small subunit